jgi:TatD DNase family protein
VASRIKELKPSMKIRMNTNGLANLYHRKNIVPELTYAIDTVSISLNAQDSETFEKLCRPSVGPDPYNSLLDFCRKCVSVGLDTVLTVVAHPAVDIAACRKIAKEMGAGFRVREYNEVG